MPLNSLLKLEWASMFLYNCSVSPFPQYTLSTPCAWSPWSCCLRLDSKTSNRVCALSCFSVTCFAPLFCLLSLLHQTGVALFTLFLRMTLFSTSCRMFVACLLLSLACCSSVNVSQLVSIIFAVTSSWYLSQSALLQFHDIMNCSFWWSVFSLTDIWVCSWSEPSSWSIWS